MMILAFFSHLFLALSAIYLDALAKRFRKNTQAKSNGDENRSDFTSPTCTFKKTRCNCRKIAGLATALSKSSEFSLSKISAPTGIFNLNRPESLAAPWHKLKTKTLST